MIATQLYTLLEKKNYHIQQVVLLSPDPDYSSEISQSCSLVKKAFKARGIPHKLLSLSDYGDINSTKACEKYQKKLEDTIWELQRDHPDCQIQLALAGGRKTMAALAVFAAQNTGIRHNQRIAVRPASSRNEASPACRFATDQRKEKS
jgi:hypothetical protein